MTPNQDNRSRSVGAASTSEPRRTNAGKAPRDEVSEHGLTMSHPTIDHADFAVVVKNRASPPKPWRWEIYRAGRNSPIERSETFFETMAEANRAGKRALASLLSEFPD